MDRRAFIAVLSGGLLGAPHAAEAQQRGTVARIGLLVTGSLDSPETRVSLGAFRQGLRERGYVEGQNIVIEYRAAEGKVERFPGLATELVRLVVAPNTLAARAAQQATTIIPIVAPAMSDPVGDGLVASLARPGGNITGLTFLGRELMPKRLELLKQAFPKVSRVVSLWHVGAFDERATGDMFKAIEGAARNLGVRLQPVGVRGPDELDRAFSTVIGERVNALIVFPSPMLYNERKRIVHLAAQHRLPSMFGAREFVVLGGLMSYGASILDLMRRGATYVDRILKGAKPAELPVEQSTTNELIVNMKTAKALGLTISQSLLLQADQVIE